MSQIPRQHAPWMLLLALGLLIAPGCNNDDGDTLDPGDETAELHYDAANDTSPSLAGATYEAAARFPSNETRDLEGGKLTEVRFFIATVPTSCKVRVYGENTFDTPGPLLYSKDVTADLTPNSWNSHDLEGAVTIPDGDLWISIEFTHALPQPTIGCDPGPKRPDGDWLFASTDNDWIPFQTRSSASVNWNIRGIVKVPN